MLDFLKSIKLYIGLVLFGALAAGWLVDRHSQYEKGFVASRTEQTAVIMKYQQLMVDREQARSVEIAKLSSEHAAEIATIEATKPIEMEKTRVIVKTIDRPAVCDLHDDELRDFNEAVKSSNGLK